MYKRQGVVSVVTGKSCGSQAEVNVLYNIQVRGRINALLLQNVFKDHFRHAPGAAQHDELFTVVPAAA